MSEMYRPHTSHAFDGPYSRISTPQGSFCIIMSSVYNGTRRPHLIHVAFYPHPEASARNLAFELAFYPPSIDVEDRGNSSYTLSARDGKNDFTYAVEEDIQHYSMSFAHPRDGQRASLEIHLTNRTPHSVLGPMWIARYLPLPLKWHVFSLSSKASVVYTTPSRTLEETGRGHMEKNWGNGFPKAWIWAQGFTKAPGGSVVFAGGLVAPGLRSTMISVRTPNGRAWDFGPSGTVQIMGCGAAISVSQSSRAGTISLTAVDYLRGRRLSLQVSAPLATFNALAAPLPEGHVDGFCHESFEATHVVRLEERTWCGSWETVEDVDMEQAGVLEFGGTWSHWYTDA